MPTYQYACTTPDCGNEFELVQSFTDPAASQCPVCGGPVRKVFSAVGVVFKGSGFYRTDSRSGSGGDGKPGKSGDSSSSAPKTESAPAASAAPSSTSSTSSTSSSSSNGSSSGSSSTSSAAARA